MTTLADKSLLSGGDNKPPMLEKHLYDSWKSRIELYMMNRPHGEHSRVSYSGLVVPVFQKGDDLIDAINHMMSFLTAVVTSRYPTTNNQLRTSSNPHQQATIYDGKAQASGQLNKEEIAFLADPGLPDIQTSQTVITHNVAYQADDLDAYDSDYDELNSAKIALMANLSKNGSDALT
ncbi:hypothetical protein Tco_1194463 [Tanacetum coccineum]